MPSNHQQRVMHRLAILMALMPLSFGLDPYSYILVRADHRKVVPDYNLHGCV
jgi:hypothetical protein